MNDTPDDPIIRQIEMYGYPLWYLSEQEREQRERAKGDAEDAWRDYRQNNG